MDNQKLIERLNDALKMEYTDVFMYAREARDIKERQIAGVFEELGLMEVRHADILSIKLLERGARPVWEFRLLEDLRDTKAILERHLRWEEAAINFYTALIEETDDAEIKIILRGIKAEEETHRDKIQQFLNLTL